MEMSGKLKAEYWLCHIPIYSCCALANGAKLENQEFPDSVPFNSQQSHQIP